MWVHVVLGAVSFRWSFRVTIWVGCFCVAGFSFGDPGAQEAHMKQASAP